MSLVLNDSTDLTSLGDAIRAKTGDSGLMTVAEMATAVSGIETSGGGGGDIDLSSLSMTTTTKSVGSTSSILNGTYMCNFTLPQGFVFGILLM